VVGLGSLAIAVVATFVAARSTRLARAATVAAARSNAIARRAIRLEEERDQRAEDAEARSERQAYADRWVAVLRTMTDELAKHGDRFAPSPAFTEGSRLIMEGEVRGFAFPHDDVTQLLVRAAALHRPILLSQASACAHALVHDWVRDPHGVSLPAQHYRAWMERRVAESDDDLRAGRPT
jgi:hypothetical protein